MSDRAADAVSLVTGATGFVGGHLVEALVGEGHHVRCLVRRTSDRSFLQSLREKDRPGAIEWAFGDVTDLGVVRRALDGVRHVYHVAGLIKARRPEDYFRVNYQGTINLLEACRRHVRATGRSLDRVLVVSSQSAAGPSPPGRPLDEDDPPRPITPYGASKLRAEVAARAFAKHLPITIVRPPSVYGPRDRETLLVFRVVRRGVRPALPVDGELSLVHARDLVRGIRIAACHPAAIGRTYFIADPRVYRFDDIVDAIAAALDVAGVQIRVPAPLLRFGGRASEVLGRLAGAPLVFDHWKAEEIIRGTWWCSSARAERELGFRAVISLADGIREAADWYRRNRWL